MELEMVTPHRVPGMVRAFNVEENSGDDLPWPACVLRVPAELAVRLGPFWRRSGGAPASLEMPRVLSQRAEL